LLGARRISKAKVVICSGNFLTLDGEIQYHAWCGLRGDNGCYLAARDS